MSMAVGSFPGETISVYSEAEREGEAPPNHPGTLACAEGIWQATDMKIDPEGPRPRKRVHRIAWLQARARAKVEAANAALSAATELQEEAAEEIQQAQEEAAEAAELPPLPVEEEEVPEGTTWPEV